MMNAIIWPAGYLPGLSDNFVSNEVIIHDLPIAAVWHLLCHPAEWPGYYGNAADPSFDKGAGPGFSSGDRFRFTTFGFPVEAQIIEYVPPEPGLAGRLAWHGWAGEQGTPTRLDVHHAWLVEALPQNRLRILTQETQNGAPAKQLATTRPNPMLNGHQDWLDGLVAAARSWKQQG